MPVYFLAKQKKATPPKQDGLILNYLKIQMKAITRVCLFPEVTTAWNTGCPCQTDLNNQ